MADILPGVIEQLPEQVSPSEESPVAADEKLRESSAEGRDAFLEGVRDVEQQAPTTPVQVSPQAIPVITISKSKDEIVIRIEKILEEGMGELYQKLPEEAKPLFKQKGEAASIEIAQMVRSLNVRVKRALQLIRDWLLTIPGVNKFFLEQQAKIKVDLIKALVDARKEDLSKKV